MFVTYDGSSTAAGVRVYVDGKPRNLSVIADCLSRTIRSSAPLLIGRRYNGDHGSPFVGSIDDVRIYARKLSSADVEALAGQDPITPLLALEKRSDEQLEVLRRYFLNHHESTYRDLAAKLRDQKQEIVSLTRPVSTAMIMQDVEAPRDTFILRRGSYAQPTDTKVFPVLYLSNPPGVDAKLRRKLLDGLAKLNEQNFRASGDREIQARIAQYELAFRMQTSVPDLMDVSRETKATFDAYGPDSRKPGTFAANCLLARRLAERGVPFVQLFHRGSDQHLSLPGEIRKNCQSTDQPAAALIADLKQRGMLDDTIVIFGGEFGRTIYSQGALTKDNYGRDHHGRCFTSWVAGGGFKPGIDYGKTDDYAYNIVEDPVHINDLNATILHCLGIEHQRFSVK